MGTHATLGVQMDDGSIMGCYVHYDGATLAERITEFLSVHTTTELVVMIAKAQASGGMRSFHSPSLDDPTPRTDYLNTAVPYAIDESDFWEDHMSTWAWYLINYTDGTLAIKEKYSNG
jgi:hypothetical protein